jgi:hypothetical protein
VRCRRAPRHVSSETDLALCQSADGSSGRGNELVGRPPRPAAGARSSLVRPGGPANCAMSRATKRDTGAMASRRTCGGRGYGSAPCDGINETSRSITHRAHVLQQPRPHHLLRYVDGNYEDRATFERLRPAARHGEASGTPSRHSIQLASDRPTLRAGVSGVAYDLQL